MKRTWSEFCEAMLEGTRSDALKIYETLKGDEKDSARRWLFGPNAEEKRESRERIKAIEEVTEAEIRLHCQTYKPRKH